MSALSDTIAAQAALLEAMLSVEIDGAVATIEPCRRVWLVGTGTSQHAAELGAWMLAPGDRAAQGISSAAFLAVAPPLDESDAVLVISHTAQSAFARRARERALAAGAGVVSITGRDRGWPEAIETIAAERSETYTASYLAALVVLARLAVALGAASFDEAPLSELPARVHAAGQAPPVLESAEHRLVVLAGAGPAAVTAREGALKLREAARVLAEGYESEYLLHGSAVPLRSGDALVAVAPGADASGLTGQLVAAASREGLHTAVVQEPAGLDPPLQQVPLTARLQRLAAELADARGEDPDRVIVGAWADDALWRAGLPSGET